MVIYIFWPHKHQKTPRKLPAENESSNTNDSEGSSSTEDENPGMWRLPSHDSPAKSRSDSFGPLGARSPKRTNTFFRRISEGAIFSPKTEGRLSTRYLPIGNVNLNVGVLTDSEVTANTE